MKIGTNGAKEQRPAWIAWERREKEEEATDDLSFGLVVPNGLARLSHVIYSDAIEAQVTHGK
jgi:hypothetical protein